MTYDIKEKLIILTHTMYCWLLSQMYKCATCDQGHIYKRMYMSEERLKLHCVIFTPI